MQLVNTDKMQFVHSWFTANDNSKVPQNIGLWKYQKPIIVVIELPESAWWNSARIHLLKVRNCQQPSGVLQKTFTHTEDGEKQNVPVFLFVLWKY